ncbi:MAG: bifunctional oligoribonuclease/PAP phosphatase NrnA [Desulfosarcinaceae bacterium]|nr:bifunctional oligoribonuclease/PAP phosphatase NrnA [Desulfosarcinaceae bacterium]
MVQIVHQLKRSRRIFVASHESPDGDAVGSLLATYLVLTEMGCRVVCYNPSPIPAVYRFLPAVEAITRDPAAAEDCDAAVILDCGNLNRIGAASARVAAMRTVINIDHHVTNTNFGTHRLIDTEACATAAIIYRLIKEAGLPLPQAAATCLYTGILTDTGSFRFSNTNREVFAICDDLTARGADPYAVAQQVYGTYSLGRIKLLNLALDSIELSANGRMSIMTLTQQMLHTTRTHPEDADGLINYARRIEDVQVAALIQELAGADGAPQAANGERRNYHVSLRSDGSVDVAEIAMSFGGGGHSSASGFSIEATLAELKTTILDLSNRIPAPCGND